LPQESNCQKYQSALLELDMDTKAIKESKEGKRSGEKATMFPEMAQKESGQHITYMYAQRAIQS